jgi:hypothetical protein
MSELAVGSLKGLSANSFVIDVASGSSLDLSAGAVLPAGSVLQVVSTTKTDGFTTTSGSFVDVTGLSATITPLSTNSKILVSYSTLVGCSLADQAAFIQLVRNSTNIALSTAGSTANQTAHFYTGITRNFTVGVLAGDFLDSPSTASATTYKLQLRAGGGTASLNRGGDTAAMGAVSTITLMEIAG